MEIQRLENDAVEYDAKSRFLQLVLDGKIDKDVPRIITLNTSQLDSYTLQAI